MNASAFDAEDATVTSNTPSFAQKIRYSCGGQLPDSMRDWVINDLTGKGAIRRHLVRTAIPVIIVLAPFWLIHASVYVRSEMTIPLLIWGVLVAQALNKPWRRYRLAQHGVDPHILDKKKSAKQALVDEDYVRRFGPRPESAAWQANSSPF